MGERKEGDKWRHAKEQGHVTTHAPDNEKAREGLVSVSSSGKSFKLLSCVGCYDCKNYLVCRKEAESNRPSERALFGERTSVL